MFRILQKLFIKDYKNTKDVRVRERYGVVMSTFSIVCNLILVIIKLLISLVTGSLAIRADGLNNLSDMGSNIASMCGFKLASKHADSEHPYGHGRIEYVAGLIISILIISMGFSSLIDSIKSIFSKDTISFNYLAIVVIIISIAIKLLMGFVNKKAGNLIASDTLLAASQDSFNDVILTFSTLVSLIIYKLFSLNIDAYVGVIVNILVIYSGIKIAIEMISTIIGKSPDKELIKEIEDYVLSNKEILGIHDMIFHDYGPGSRFLTFHAEVDASKDIVYLHDNVDNIENYILGKYAIVTTIHMDPLTLNDPVLNTYREMILKAVKDINADYSIHDFRIVKGPTHTNLVFDLLVPVSDDKDHALIRKEINKKIRDIAPNLNISMKIEHGFID